MHQAIPETSGFLILQMCWGLQKVTQPEQKFLIENTQVVVEMGLEFGFFEFKGNYVFNFFQLVNVQPYKLQQFRNVLLGLLNLNFPVLFSHAFAEIAVEAQPQKHKFLLLLFPHIEVKHIVARHIFLLLRKVVWIGAQVPRRER